MVRTGLASIAIAIACFFGLSVADTVQFPHPYSLSFPGTSDAPDVRSDTLTFANALTQFTLEAWIQLSPSAPSTAINTIAARNRGAGGSGVNFGVSSGRVGCGINSGAYNRGLSGNTVLTAGVWTHVACSYDGTTFRVYVNGQADGAAAATDGAGVQYPMLSPTNPFVIGSEDTVTGRGFTGAIDNVRIWGLVRADSDIANTYNTRPDYAATGLLSYVAFRPVQAGGRYGTEPFEYRRTALTGWTWISATGTQGLTLLSGSGGGACTAAGCSAPYASYYPASLLFDGATGDVRFSNAAYGVSAITYTFTLEAWIRITSLAPANTPLTIIAKNRGAGGTGLAMGLFNYAISCGINSGAVNRGFGSTAGPIAFDVWTHVACVYDGTNFALYQNGAPVGVSANTGVAGPMLSSTNPFVIGSEDTVTGRIYSWAHIDTVRVWNTARTQAQVAASMSSYPIGTEAGLVSWVTFRSNNAGSWEPVENSVAASAAGSWSASPAAASFSLWDVPSGCPEFGCGSPFAHGVNECASANGGCGYLGCSDTAAGRLCNGWPFTTSNVGGGNMWTGPFIIGSSRPTVCMFNALWHVFFNQNDNNCYHTQSADGGVTWSAPVMLSGAAATFQNPKCFIRAGNTGVIHVVAAPSTTNSELNLYQSSDLSNFSPVAVAYNSDLGLNCASPASVWPNSDGSFVVACTDSLTYIQVAYVLPGAGYGEYTTNTRLQTAAGQAPFIANFNGLYHLYYQDANTVNNACIGLGGCIAITDPQTQLLHSATTTPYSTAGWPAPSAPDATITNAVSGVVKDGLLQLFWRDGGGNGLMHWHTNGVDSTQDGYDAVAYTGVNTAAGNDVFCTNWRCIAACRWQDTTQLTTEHTN